MLDLVLERQFSFAADDDLENPSEGLRARLDAALLLEGPVAVRLREQVRAAKSGLRLHAPVVDPAPDVWGLAEALPDLIDARWRQPEAWRRLAEAQRAGQEWLMFPQFLTHEAATAIRDDVAAWPFARLDTALVHAEWLSPPDGGPLGELVRLGPLRELFGALLSVALPPAVRVNAWRMRPGDSMGVHPDGSRYLATFSLGLNEGWTAADGGAIAFGDPQPDAFVVRQRWLPHLGDWLLFKPHAQSWHAVEPVVRRERLTLTGWYLG